MAEKFLISTWKSERAWDSLFGLMCLYHDALEVHGPPACGGGRIAGDLPRLSLSW
jgi:hypothetical protein